MASKSMTDTAYDILSKKKRGVLFQKLWEDVSKATKASNDLIAQFYSDLTLDSRFALLKDGKWDLVERRKFEESHIDISSIELDEDEPEDSGDDGEIINSEDTY